MYGSYWFLEVVNGIMSWWQFLFWSFVILEAIARWKLFAKCGTDSYKAFIPFYSSYTAFELFWGDGKLFLLSLVPVVGIGVTYIMLYKMAKSFGKDDSFLIGMLLLPGIFSIIMAFDDSTYIGAQK